MSSLSNFSFPFPAILLKFKWNPTDDTLHRSEKLEIKTDGTIGKTEQCLINMNFITDTRTMLNWIHIESIAESKFETDGTI